MAPIPAGVWFDRSLISACEVRGEPTVMRESIRLGRIAGVNVGLNLSVLVVVAILVSGWQPDGSLRSFPARAPRRTRWPPSARPSCSSHPCSRTRSPKRSYHSAMAARPRGSRCGSSAGSAAEAWAEDARRGLPNRRCRPVYKPRDRHRLRAVVGVLDLAGQPDLATGVFAYISVVNVMSPGSTSFRPPRWAAGRCCVQRAPLVPTRRSRA
jgi:hypothetical protein